MEHKVESDRKGNKDHRDLLVREETKVTEASRVIWDLQVLKEKLVKEETWDKKVNQVTEA